MKQWLTTNMEDRKKERKKGKFSSSSREKETHTCVIYMDEECVNCEQKYYIYSSTIFGSEWGMGGFVTVWNSQPPKIFFAFPTLEVLLARKLVP